MKKKITTALLSIVFALSFCFGISAMALNDSSKEEITVKDVNYTSNLLGGYGASIVLGMGEDCGAFWTALDATCIQMADASGTDIVVTSAETCGTSAVINRGTTRASVVGDKITVKSGFVFNGKEIKSDVTYDYKTENQPWILHSDAEKEEITVKDVNYTANLLGGYGASIVLGMGEDCKAYWTALDATCIQMADASGADIAVTSAETCGTSAVINRGTTRASVVGDKITVKSGFVFNGKEIKSDVTYVNTTDGQPWELITLPLTVNTAPGTAYGCDINIFNDTKWSAPTIQVNFKTVNAFGLYYNAGVTGIEYVNAYGDTVSLFDCTNVGNSYFIIRLSDPASSNIVYAMNGDKLTFKKGFSVAKGEAFQADTTYMVVDSSGEKQLAPYTSDMDGKGLAITNTDDYKELAVGATLQLTYKMTSGYGTPYFTSSDQTKATVTKDGLVTAVAEGSAIITATMNGEAATYAMTVLPAVDIAGVEIVNQFAIYVAQNETLKMPELKAHVKFADGSFGAEFALVEGENFTISTFDASVLGEKELDTVVIYQNKEYTVKFTVNVYKIGNVEIKEIGIVDWFSYSVFVQYPNSTVNFGNITDTSKINGVLDHITYKRADGTDVPITGYYMLGGGNIALFMFSDLTKDNYNQYYLAGDLLTLKQGMKIWQWTGKTGATETDNNAIVAGTGMFIVEGILENDVVYRYDGNVWGLYVEYTDISATNLNISVVAGKSVDSGVSRVPSNATTGTYTYTSSDSTVATVSSRGIIKGIKAGTCSVNVTIDGGTAGKKTLTINITVTDEITGIAFGKDSIEVKLNGTIDYASLNATYKWASGKQGEAVDFTNVKAVGFDSAAVGEQNVVLTVTVDGKEISGSITVNVVEETKKGCFSGMNSAAGGISVLLTLVFAAAVLKKKKV